ncbi:MAG: ABC transporter permease [Clostridiales bacterium]|nr:ABC transporter permease [Clostridiales bacterium]
MRNISKERESENTDNSYAKISPIKKAIRTKAFPLFILLVVVIAVFAVLSPLGNDGFQAFFRMKTFWRILQDLAVPGFLTIGVGLLIVSGSIDLSAASAGSLSGVIIAVCMAWTDISWPVAIVIGLVAAALVGVINAVLVNELKQPPFIATMAMSIVLGAVMQIICTDKTGQLIGQVNFSNDFIQQIGTYKIFGEVPAASMVMVFFFIIYGLALSKSKFGRTLYLMGGNQAAAHLAGINAKRFSYFLFINSSVLASFSGIVNASRVKMGGAQALANLQFTGITAAILGGISFGGGSGGLGGAFLGLLVINTFGTGMTSSGASPYMTPVLSGILLIAALTFDYFNIRAQNKRVGA